MKVCCPQCGAALQAREEHVGRQAKCPTCGTRFVIAKPTPAPPPAEVPVATPAVPPPTDVPAEEDIAPDIVVWVHTRDKGVAEPVCVADLMLGPEYLGIIRRGKVPVLGSSIHDEQRAEKARAFGVIGVLVNELSNQSTPGFRITKHTNESRLGGLFRRAAKKRRDEAGVLLTNRIADNQGSFSIAYREIAAIEKQETGTVRLIMADRAYHLTAYEKLNRFRRWLSRFSKITGIAFHDPALQGRADGKIRLECKACGRTIALPPSRAGEGARCVYCGAPINVPDADGASPQPAPVAGSLAASAKDNILQYLRLMAEGRLEDAARFAHDLTANQQEQVAAALPQIRPDELTHPSLADVPAPVIRRFMNQMRDELQHRGAS